jgi:long-chain fatty acid transport protein
LTLDTCHRDSNKTKHKGMKIPGQLKMDKNRIGGVLCLCVSSWAHAGGIMLYEVGSDNTGLANAGAAARAQGPSTIASNPAGLSYLEGTQISAGAQLLFGNVSFDQDASTTSNGANGDNGLASGYRRYLRAG